MRDGATLISYIQPAQNAALVDALAAKQLTVLAMDQVPRISRDGRVTLLVLTGIDSITRFFFPAWMIVSRV